MSGRPFRRFVVALVVLGAGICVTLWWTRPTTKAYAPAKAGAPDDTAAGDSLNETPIRGPGGQGAGYGASRAGTGPSAALTEALAEAQTMADLRRLAETDPEAAVALAGEGNRRFRDSAAAPERTAILIHALAAVGRSSEARGEAEIMVNQYADSSWVREIERFTGAHRHRNVYVTDAGAIEFR